MEGNIINGKKNGAWKIFLKDNNAYYLGSFIDDQKGGKWKEFGIIKGDTVLQMKGFYKNDLREGKFIYYANDTVIRWISNYKADKLNGEDLCFEFSRNHNPVRVETKYLASITNYKDDKKNGTEKEYRLDDNNKPYLFQISEYLNDKKVGKSIIFSSKGDTLAIRDHSNGSYWGITQFRKTKIGDKYIITYKKTKDTTIDIDLNDDGDTLRFKTFNNETGYEKYYGEDTIDKKLKINKEFYYKNKTDITYKKYYNNGRLAYEIQFEKGLPYSAVCAYSNDGKKLDFGTLKEGNGTLNFYYPEGNLKSSFTYYNSVCKGKVICYYKNGNIEIEGIMLGIKPSTLEFDEYTDDDINHYYLEKNISLVDIKCYHENKTNMSIINNDTINKITSLTYFYTNGNLSSISSEINNKSTGKYAKYYEDGKLAEEGKYKITKDSSSQKDSIWNYYYKEGLLRASIFYNEGKIKGTSKYYDKIGKLRRIEIIENDGKHYNIFDGDTVNYTDKNGLKQGKWIGFPYSFMSEKEFCDDVPSQIEYFKNGNPIGIWENNRPERFYDVGKKKYIWKDSTLAYCYVYNKKDQIQEEGEIIYPDLKFGLWKEYDNDKGYLKTEGQYFLNEKVGKWKIFKKNGKVKSIIDYDKVKMS